LKKPCKLILFFTLVILQVFLLRQISGQAQSTDSTDREEVPEEVWQDVCYFPIPDSSKTEEDTCSYEDSWQSERTYGGIRGHEGCDIMMANNVRGWYPVVSVSDGVVEKMGWLPQGGYRIGIRSEHDVYFYYAHLESYAAGITIGTQISAGQLLGFAGDSGYGEEGTVGMFPVHLHFGIYLNDENGEEYSINSYPVLLYLNDKRLTFSY
jgi:murein DD-endopeptidase MepM/ murein hydrolase activator NlpD